MNIFLSAFTAGDLDTIEGGINGFNFSGSTVGDLFGGNGGLGLNAIIFFLGGFALMVYLVFGGIQVMTAASNPDQASEGKAKVTNAVIGFLIIFVAFWIVQALGLILGLDAITTTFG